MNGHVTCHQHKTRCIFSKSVSKLLWSAFAQPAQGCRFPNEIIITNLVHSHDWVHGIFLCLNGVWSLSGPQWYSVETELLFYGQQKGNIHLGQDELKEQLRGKKVQERVTQGCRRYIYIQYIQKHDVKSFLCNVCPLLSFEIIFSVTLVFQKKTEEPLQTVSHLTFSSGFTHIFKFKHLA